MGIFQRLYAFDAISDPSGRTFWPFAYGRMEADLTWSGFLVFFVAEKDTASAIATPPETTESSAEAVTSWAVGLSRAHLQNALERALQLEASLVVAELGAAEGPEAVEPEPVV